MNFLFYFAIVLLVIAIKNYATCSVRIWFIHNQWDAYSKLPSYNGMMFSPFRWTRKQWQEYVK